MCCRSCHNGGCSVADGERSVTLALIDAKLDDAISILSELKAEQNKLEDRVRENEKEIARLCERLGLIAGVLAAASLLLSLAAGILGAIF
jgi:Mg2+ and Co2+ transporter CorA